MLRLLLILAVALALGIAVASAQDDPAPPSPRLFGYSPGDGLVEGAAEATAFRREAGCYRFSLDAIGRAIEEGRLRLAASDDARWRGRACTIVAMCDVIDGTANLFARLEATPVEPDSLRRQDLSHCAGVSRFGPALIAAEPELFAIVERFR